MCGMPYKFKKKMKKVELVGGKKKVVGNPGGWKQPTKKNVM